MVAEPQRKSPRNLAVNWQLFTSQVHCLFGGGVGVEEVCRTGRLLKVLEDRKQLIAEGIENADKIKAELASTQEAKDKILSDANTKAQELIDEARAAAEKVGEAKAQEAVKQAEEIIRKAREATSADRDTMMAELKAEIGRLVVETTAKVSGKVLTSEDQQRLIDETNKELAA